MSNQENQELIQARARWRQAQQDLSKHEIKSDPVLDLELLTRAREFSAWRGVAALAGAWLLPEFPAMVGETEWPAAQALFVGLGAVSLCFALWWLAVDGRKWLRWARARRDLGRGKYKSRPLALSLGLPENASLSHVDYDSDEWVKLGEWVKMDRQLEATWKRWGKGNAQVRRHDMRVLEEAVIALSRLREIKAGTAEEPEEPGKTPVKAAE